MQVLVVFFKRMLARLFAGSPESLIASYLSASNIEPNIDDRPNPVDDALQLSFHSGIRPGVQGAPAASIAFSRFARSPSMSGRSRLSTCSNSCAAAA